jgi:type 1 fimbriae regulatory protein FimB
MGENAKNAAVPEHYINNVRLAKNPNKKGKKRKPKRLPPYLTEDEKCRFFSAVKSPRDRAVFRLMYHHGLRVSEIGKLQMSDYRQGSSAQLDRLYIHRLKGSISGEHVVVPAAAFAVRAWIRVRGYKPGTLFMSRLGSPLSRNWLFELMQRYCRQAEIPPEKAHPHCFKHTCCTHLVSDCGESILDVRNHVGHKALASTLIYSQLTERATEARARRLRDWK